VKDLRDRVAAVTGAASGIGRSLAARLAAEGMGGGHEGDAGGH
jgi:NAD(P)-dependent dehydrogenase (short-subunit alcohol dehydrogenase family)